MAPLFKPFPNTLRIKSHLEKVLAGTREKSFQTLQNRISWIRRLTKKRAFFLIRHLKGMVRSSCLLLVMLLADECRIRSWILYIVHWTDSVMAVKYLYPKFMDLKKRNLSSSFQDNHASLRPAASHQFIYPKSRTLARSKSCNYAFRTRHERSEWAKVWTSIDFNQEPDYRATFAISIPPNRIVWNINKGLQNPYLERDCWGIALLFGQ
jgi:hypothetical protein